MINSFVKRFKKSSINRSLNILSRSDKSKLVFITIVQVLLGVLDLVGVVAIGALGALSIQGIESQGPGNKVSQLLLFLHIQHFSFQKQVLILGTSAALILISKTIISIFFTRKTFFFLSNKGATLSGDLISKVLSLDMISLQKRSAQEILYIVSDGVKFLTLGILATLVTLISDGALLIIMTIGLLLVDPIVAIATALLFAAVGILLHKLLQVRAKELGIEANVLTVLSNQKIIEVLASYRESVVRNRRRYYADEIRNLRLKLSVVSAETAFMPYTSKYVIESTSVIGSLALAGFEFGTKNAVHAVAVLSVFLAASSRIAPAALRIQQGILTIKNSIGASEGTLGMLDELKDMILPNDLENVNISAYPGFSPSIKISNVSFRYSANEKFAISDVDFVIQPGSSTAIVGPSGSGKTTLVDLMLGILQPQKGSVLISGVSPQEASKKWAGAISYVPQNVVIASGSIRENVALGYPISFATDQRILKALEKARLLDTVKSLNLGLDAPVGEFGSKISGGQRQRLGIARALFTNPRLLVLDEATSALDGVTETELSESIQNLSDEVTLIIVAHRLTTIRNVDQVVYISDGKIQTIGTFDQVRARIPDFDKQANIAGL